MRKQRLFKIYGVSAALAVTAAPFGASAQQTALLRSLPDYSYAGYGFGLAAIPQLHGTVINATDHGVIADDGRDDTVALRAAMAAANAVNGPVVLRLPAGRVQLSQVLRIERSDFILAGAGEGGGGTELYIPRPLRFADTGTEFDELRAYLIREDKVQREPENGINHLFTEWSWSGGFLFVGRAGARVNSYDAALDRAPDVMTSGVAGRQHARELTVANGATLRAGQIIRLQWFAREGRASSIIRSIYGDTDQQVGSHHWSFPNRATVVQSTRITAIRGNRLTLGDPLLHDVRADQPAAVTRWDPLTNVGIQDFRITFPDSNWFGHHLEDGYNGIWFTGAFDGWVRNVAIHNADSGILTDDAANLTISNVHTTGEHRAHYAVHVGSVHNVLVQAVRVDNPVIHPLTFNTRSTRSVYQRAVVTRGAQFDQHSGSNHFNLFDAVTIYVAPMQRDGRWTWRLWEGGGAGYWRPGHGRGNTAWNIRVVVPDSVPADAEVELTSGIEGPGKTIVGVHGNRRLSISYRPQPRTELLNQEPATASLYDMQLAARRR
jgi:hypothetical protein